MDYLKFTAGEIFDGYRFLGPGHALIAKGNGMIEDIVPLTEAGDDVRAVQGIISPGLINCHCHLELSHMKGLLPKGQGLIGFITSVMTSRSSGKEAILQAISNADSEMENNGIVAVGDICNTSFTIAEKHQSRIHYHNFIEALGFHPDTAHERYQAALNVFNLFATDFPGRSSLVPHAPYSVAPSLFKQINHLPGNQLLSIHNQESPDENLLFQNASGGFPGFYSELGMRLDFFQPSGKSSLEAVLPHFLRHQRVILVHNVETTRADLDALDNFSNSSAVNFHLCLCPNANLYISGKLPDVPMLSSGKQDIVLGTDSLASNDELSILGEMKTISNHFPLIAVEELFSWATLNGARALQMEKLLGSFERGKIPGIICSSADLTTTVRLL